MDGGAVIRPATVSGGYVQTTTPPLRGQGKRCMGRHSDCISPRRSGRESRQRGQEDVMSLRSCARASVLIVLLCPAAANADWIFTPHFGTTFGADTHGREHAVFGGSLAKFDEDAFGWEADVSFIPDFFKGRYGNIDF